jgi:hypothetical protein
MSVQTEGLSAQEAIKAAKALALDVFAEDVGSPPSLESVSPSREFWEICLSFKRAKPLAAGGLGLSMDPSLVNYRKLFRIDRADGSLVSISDPE